ncbi:LAS seventeen-binding protein 1/2, partial [Lecanoromycetidae sp. Uapishka_2]
MRNMEEQSAAMTNRSLRNIRTELEFLTDSSVITPQQLSNFLSQLPAQTSLHAPLQSPAPTPAPTQTTPLSPPVNQLNNASLNEKQNNFYAPTPVHPLPPPAYGTPLAPATLATASALYEYHPSDAGDLAIQPNDRVFITEFMNADWAKGRNERTGMEGIFPRSYVAIVDEKKNGPPPPPMQINYGNMPLDVSQSSSGATPKPESKLNANGKKFGKKMGNAAIFGAGATIGSNIVNGIF